MAEAVEGPLLSDRTAEEATRPMVNCAIAFIILNTIFVIARSVSRHWIAKLPFWWDDFWVLPAYFFILALAGLGIAQAKVEVAYDNTDRVILNLNELSDLLKIIYAFIQILLPSFAATRFSILALYLRIFSDRGVRWATWIAVIFITLQYVAFAIAAVFMCTPVQFFWNRAIPGGHCINIDAFYRSITIPNIVMDVAIVIIPIPTVWQLKASRMRKWALTFVFCIGTIALVASCIRLWIYETHTGEILAPQYTNVLIAWLIVEPSIYLIAACLPAMHHVFSTITPKVLSDWFEKRMAAIKHPLSRTGRDTGASHVDRLGKNALYGDFSRLTDGENDETLNREGNNSVIRAERKRSGRKNSGKDSEVYELEQGGFPSGGIMVTQEVIVTQEERIADVIGF